MGSGLSFTVNTSRLEARLQQYKDNLHQVLRSEWANILGEVVRDVQRRAPIGGKFAEDVYILGGNHPTVTYLSAPLQGGSKGHWMLRRGGGPAGQPGSGTQWIHSSGVRTHLVDRRLSLAEAAEAPQNWEMDPANFTLKVGRVSFLDVATQISWVNYSRVSGAHPHTSTYGVWSFFEYGKTNTVTPNKFWNNRYRAHLKLGNGLELESIDKAYPKLMMYTDPGIRSFIQHSIVQRFRAIKF